LEPGGGGRAGGVYVTWILEPKVQLGMQDVELLVDHRFGMELGLMMELGIEVEVKQVKNFP
jgi:hypothetical protein